MAEEINLILQDKGPDRLEARGAAVKSWTGTRWRHYRQHGLQPGQLVAG